MNNPVSNQTTQTVANALSGERSFCRIEFAVTGDAIADVMAGFRKVADSSGLSARQIQFIFECYALLYKDAADKNDKDALLRDKMKGLASYPSQAQDPLPPPWSVLPHTTCSGPLLTEEKEAAIRSQIAYGMLRNKPVK